MGLPNIIMANEQNIKEQMQVHINARRALLSRNPRHQRRALRELAFMEELIGGRQEPFSYTPPEEQNPTPITKELPKPEAPKEEVTDTKEEKKDKPAPEDKKAEENDEKEKEKPAPKKKATKKDKK